MEEGIASVAARASCGLAAPKIDQSLSLFFYIIFIYCFFLRVILNVCNYYASITREGRGLIDICLEVPLFIVSMLLNKILIICYREKDEGLKRYHS